MEIEVVCLVNPTQKLVIDANPAKKPKVKANSTQKPIVEIVEVQNVIARTSQVLKARTKAMKHGQKTHTLKEDQKRIGYH